MSEELQIKLLNLNFDNESFDNLNNLGIKLK